MSHGCKAPFRNAGRSRRHSINPSNVVAERPRASETIARGRRGMGTAGQCHEDLFGRQRCDLFPFDDVVDLLAELVDHVARCLLRRFWGVEVVDEIVCRDGSAHLVNNARLVPVWSPGFGRFLEDDGFCTSAAPRLGCRGQRYFGGNETTKRGEEFSQA